MTTRRSIASDLAAFGLCLAVTMTVSAFMGWLIGISWDGFLKVSGLAVFLMGSVFFYLNVIQKAMIRGRLAPHWRLLLGITSLLFMAVSYTGLYHYQKKINPSDKMVPSGSEFISGLGKMLTPEEEEGEISFTEDEAKSSKSWSFLATPLGKDSRATLGRLFVGLGLGVLMAVILGFLMGTFPAVESFLNPPLTIASKVNPIAMLGIFLALFSTGEPLYSAMIVFGVLPGLAITIFLAIKNDVPDELIHKAYTLGASHAEVIGLVIGRQVLPRIIEGVRAMIGPAIVYLIAVEWTNGAVGFGYRIRIESRLLSMEQVYPYIGILALYGYIIDFALTKSLRWLCPWYTREEDNSQDGSFWTGIRSLFAFLVPPAPKEKSA